MINDQQVKKLRSDLNGGMRLAAAALRGNQKGDIDNVPLLVCPKPKQPNTDFLESIVILV